VSHWNERRESLQNFRQSVNRKERTCKEPHSGSEQPDYGRALLHDYLNSRRHNPDLRIVARCIDQKFAERLMKAGADSTVSPNQIGGMRIASEVLRPHVVNFLDLMLKDKSRTLRIEEIEIPEHSSWIGKRVADLHLRGSYNLLPLALKDAYHDGKKHGFWVNPPENVTCHAGLVLIVLGDTKDVSNAREDAAGLAMFAAR